MKSRFQLQQAALAKPVPPADVKSTPTPPARPDAPTRGRGRPKTRLSTLDEVAAYLHVSRSTIYRLIDTKALPHLRIGFVLRFDLPTVLRWAERFTASGDQLTWADDTPGINRERGTINP